MTTNDKTKKDDDLELIIRMDQVISPEFPDQLKTETAADVWPELRDRMVELVGEAYCDCGQARSRGYCDPCDRDE